MFDLVTRYWWVLVVRGVLAFLLGLLALGWPGLTLEVFILWFGAFALVDGVFAIFNAIGARSENDDWWLVLLGGLASVLVGVVTFRAPGLALVALLLYVAAWALVKGVVEIVAAVRLRRVIEGEFWLALGGVASIAFAVLLMAYPLMGALTLLWVIGIYAMVFGVIMVMLGFRVRSLHAHPGPAARVLARP